MQRDDANVLHFPASRSRYVRRLRVLRRVTHVTPRRFEVTQGYGLTFFRVTLECGHAVLAFPGINDKAVRRVCWDCSRASQAVKVTPAIPFPANHEDQHAS